MYFKRMTPQGEKWIPANLDEAVEHILTEAPEGDREALRTNPSHMFHFGFGSQIRNEWHLWDKTSPLATSIGKQHPDEKSDLIIRTVQARLSNAEVPEK